MQRSSVPFSRFRTQGMRRETLQGVALAAAALSAGAADAAVVYSGVVNLQTLSGGKVSNTIRVGLPGDQELSIGFDFASDSSLRRVFATGAGGGGRPSFIAQGNALQALIEGSLVDDTASYQFGPQNLFGTTASGKAGSSAPANWAPGTTAFFGFRFDVDGLMQYGWGRFSLGNDRSDSYLVDYAYDDSGAALAVGQTVPEPGMPWLVLAGLLALAASRQRPAAAGPA